MSQTRTRLSSSVSAFYVNMPARVQFQSYILAYGAYLVDVIILGILDDNFSRQTFFFSYNFLRALSKTELPDIADVNFTLMFYIFYICIYVYKMLKSIKTIFFNCTKVIKKKKLTEFAFVKSFVNLLFLEIF